MPSLVTLLTQVRACTLCAAHLPLGPRPVLQAHTQARLLIAGQAPGRKVHDTGLPFNDASGDRLRQWLGLSREVFYDAQQVAIVPMGFCFPGTGPSGDLPPRPECAPAWRSTWPHTIALPHPSPRNNRWLKQNPWFEEELLPVLRERVRESTSPGR
jgi:uracil-DNA glycosylase